MLVRRYTGADLNALVREAALKALEESIEAKSIAARHFHAALTRLTPSPAPSDELLGVYATFQRGIQ